jgi:hypothetical protein
MANKAATQRAEPGLVETGPFAHALCGSAEIPID